MASSRSQVELLALRVEAERMVRAGVARAEVSRLLCVHLQTLAQWALAGGWRKKDLEAERVVDDAAAAIRGMLADQIRDDAQDAQNKRAVELLNEARRIRGLKPVNARERLEEIARELGGPVARLPPPAKPGEVAGRKAD